MEYIIQLRITRTPDKHVCKACGRDAYLRGVSYEATSQDAADRLQDEVQRAVTLEQALDVPKISKVNDTIFDATVEEQRTSGPQEHERYYQCAVCFGDLVSFMMGNTSGVEVVRWLKTSPLTYAVFAVRKIEKPDQCLLAVGKDHDPLLVLAALEAEDTLHLKPS